MSAERDPHPGGIKTSAERDPHPGGIKTSAERDPHPGGIKMSAERDPHPGGIKTSTALAPALARFLVDLAGWLHPVRRAEWLADVRYLQSRDRDGLWEAVSYLSGAPWLSLRQVGFQVTSVPMLWREAGCGGALIFGVVHILGAALSASLVSRRALGPGTVAPVALSGWLGLGLVVGLAVALGRRRPSGTTVLGGLGLVLGLLASVASRPGQSVGFALGLPLTVGLAYWLANRLGVGAVYGVSLGAVYGLYAVIGDGRPSGLDVAALDVLSLLAAPLGATLGAALASRLPAARAIVLGAALGAGLLYGLVVPLAESATRSMSGILASSGAIPAIWLGFGLIGGLVAGLTGRGLEDAGVGGPRLPKEA
jgi:hypothetical protein